MGSDESHFNMLLIVKDKLQPFFFKEKGEPKRIRAEVIAAYQFNALPLGQTDSRSLESVVLLKVKVQGF